jgi:nucleoside-diphosphate-sugar epimerase
VRQEASLVRLGGCDFRITRFASDQDVETEIRHFEPEVVIHTAGCYGRHGESLAQLLDANVRFGLVVLNALLVSPRPSTFVYTGTALPAGLNGYALSKHQFAQWGQQCAGKSGNRLQFVHVLLEHMYGPEDDITKFSARVIAACLNNEPEFALTDGRQTRDFIHIEDVVRAYGALLDGRNKLAPYQDVPVGSGEAVEIRTFVEGVHRAANSTTRLMFGAVPHRPGEVMHSQADTKLIRGLGWQPTYDLQAGLAQTISAERLRQVRGFNR